METNNLFKHYTKADLPALQVYVPQLMGEPGTVLTERRTGKGNRHNHCQLIEVDCPAFTLTVCVTENPWDVQVAIRIGTLGHNCPPQFVQRLINPTVGQLIRAICNYVQRCLDAANDADGGQWAA